MKFLKKIGLFAASLLVMTACVDKDPEFQDFPDPDVDFTYNVAGDEYTLDFYVVTSIQFNNVSSKSGAVTWNFGDGTTSTDANPIHKYEAAGLYNVTLSIDGVGSRTYPILIHDIVPILSVKEQSADPLVINDETVELQIALPNPENLKVKYVWTFPEGTMDANGNEMTTFTGYSDETGKVDYPGALKFKHVGSQRINIETWFDTEGENRRLEDAYYNVQVGCNYECPTLYYATYRGNIKAFKLVDFSKLPEGTKVFPYDMGVNSGAMPFNLAYGEVETTDDEGETTNQGWIYIADAGKQYYYINDENGVLGDGNITAMKVDGTGVNQVITNVGGAAFLDPFQMQVYDGNIYYTDRNTGISAIPQTTRGAVEGQKSTTERTNYFVKNDLIPYYNKGIAFGAIHAGFQRDSRGVWWWAKNYSGNGIYRFKTTDIYETQAAAVAHDMPYPIVLSGIQLRSFVIDEANKLLYVWRLTVDEGFSVYALPGDTEGGAQGSPLTKILMDCDPINSTASEGVYVSQLALDKETGKVYFGFRPTSTDSSKIPAGVCVYDNETKTVTHYGEGNDLILGMVINPTKSKLF